MSVTCDTNNCCRHECPSKVYSDADGLRPVLCEDHNAVAEQERKARPFILVTYTYMVAMSVFFAYCSPALCAAAFGIFFIGSFIPPQYPLYQIATVLVGFMVLAAATSKAFNVVSPITLLLMSLPGAALFVLMFLYVMALRGYRW